MKKTSLILLLILTFTACKKSDKTAKMIGTDWLIGKWEQKTDQGIASETWEKVNDSTYKGHSFFIKSKDTLHFETMQLNQKGESIFYTSTIKGQNNDAPVTFNLSSVTKKQLVFDNPKNEYPRKIVYKQITSDSIIATISGIQQGKPSSESYSMKKSK